MLEKFQGGPTRPDPTFACQAPSSWPLPRAGFPMLAPSRSACNWRSRFKEAIKIESSCQYLLHWSSFLNKGPQKKSLPGEILRRSQERSAGGVHSTLGNWTVGGFPQKKLHVYLITEPAVGLLPQSRHRSLIPWHYKAWEHSFYLFINTLYSCSILEGGWGSKQKLGVKGRGLGLDGTDWGRKDKIT